MIGREGLPALLGKMHRWGWQGPFLPLGFHACLAGEDKMPPGEAVLRTWARTQIVAWRGRPSRIVRWSSLLNHATMIGTEPSRRGMTAV